MKLSRLKTDPVKREQGDWVRDIPDFPGLAIKTRGLRNKDAQRLTQEFLEALPRKERRGKLSPENRDKLNTLILVETATLDWNLQNDDGSPIPFSKEKLEELLTNEEYVEFRDACVVAALIVADIDEEDQADDAKK